MSDERPDDSRPPTGAPDPRDLLRLGLEGPGEDPPEFFVTRSPGPDAENAPSPAELAPLFPQFEIEELIGQGGMGMVYRARQISLDRPVALKLIPASVSQDPTFAERFQREARTLASLTHPNIVGVHDFGRAGPYPYLVLEFIDGPSLRQVMATKAIGPAQALQIVTQICEALQYAHDEGVVHRDIKPENVLLDRKGRVKITDFGLAKLLGRNEGRVSLTHTHQVMGTPHYMAPEQVDRPLHVDHRADIYSLGVVFYELLTGELPMGRFAPPSEKAGVDARLDEIVNKSLEAEPDRRYQSAVEIRSDVDGVRTGPTPEPPPRAEPTSTPRYRPGASSRGRDRVVMRVRRPHHAKQGHVVAHHGRSRGTRRPVEGEPRPARPDRSGGGGRTSALAIGCLLALAIPFAVALFWGSAGMRVSHDPDPWYVDAPQMPSSWSPSSQYDGQPNNEALIRAAADLPFDSDTLENLERIALRGDFNPADQILYATLALDTMTGSDQIAAIEALLARDDVTRDVIEYLIVSLDKVTFSSDRDTLLGWLTSYEPVDPPEITGISEDSILSEGDTVELLSDEADSASVGGGEPNEHTPALPSNLPPVEDD